MTDPGREGPDAASVADVPAAAAPTTIGRASAFLASGTLVSRLLGFVSAIVLATAISVNGGAGDTFALANQLPNNIYSLIAGGLLSAVIVPQIVKANLHSDGGAAFINRVITIGLVVFVVVTVIATLCAPLLNARGVFGPFTWAPVLNNIVVIGSLILFIALFGGASEHREATSWTPVQIAVVGGGATLGIAVQAFALFFFLKRAGLSYRPNFQWRGVGLASTGRAASWVFAMFLVTQVSGVVEANVASSATGEASINAMKYGWLMFMLPHSIATVSIVTAYYTRMSSHVRDSRLGDLGDDLSSALRSSLLIIVFSAVGLAVLAFPFSAIFGQNYSEVSSLAPVYLGYLLGLVPFTIFFVLLRVFYALDRTRAAFVIQVVQTAFYVVCALLVGVLVPREWVAVALAVVLSAAVALQGLLSAVYLRRALGHLDTWRVLRRTLWFAAAAVPAGAVGWGILTLLGGVGQGAFPVDGRPGAITTMVIAGAAMAIVYAVLLWVTRNPELRAFGEPLLRRLRRAR